MEIHDKKYLGWGIMGTPDGFQSCTGGGIEQEMHLASHWDLPSEIAKVLPNPESGVRDPLFRFTSYKTEENYVHAFAGYVSIKQMRSHRSGTFLGAFIESLDSQFSPNSSEMLIKSLFTLLKKQYHSFVDSNESVYKEELRNKTCPINSDEFINGIYINPKFCFESHKKILIYCNYNDFYDLVKFILETRLFAFYSDVYFTYSDEINKNIKEISGLDIVILDFYSLKSVFPCFLDISYLAMSSFNDNLNIKKNYQNELNKICENYKLSLREEIENINQTTIKKISSLENEVKENQEYILNLENSLEDYSKLSNLIKIITLNVNEYQGTDVGRKIITQDLVEENKNLKNRCDSLSKQNHDIRNKYDKDVEHLNREVKLSKKTKPITYVLAFLSIAFGLAFLILSAIYYFDDTSDKLIKINSELEIERNNNINLKENMSNLDKQLQQLNGDQERTDILNKCLMEKGDKKKCSKD
ncbi:hypothetical protein HPC38_01775 [Pasteurellaceae bacterium HPA106]|uniref:hypothetical protein n=1 Tax=Spirabiliibacterium pneumoniae TaxID=221400 RepID=UPI001AACC959|nr:hypothetical protein [Spirabiliibacterium pneumoniae]MBE2895605.1 hypothetical protein [Spirabiliibacterium pneumoniae]